MDNLNITVDLETCSLCPTAAVMSVGAVAWNPENTETPFLSKKDCLCSSQFLEHVDLRSQFLDGFDFDAATAAWWKSAKPEARAAVLANDDIPLQPIREVILNLFAWIEHIKESCNANSVHLWAQGTDFDIAILRHICHVCVLKMPISHQSFRDHRSVYLENAKFFCKLAGKSFDEKEAYHLVAEYKEEGAPHDPIFDCKRSISSTWQMFRLLEEKVNELKYYSHTGII